MPKGSDDSDGLIDQVAIFGDYNSAYRLEEVCIILFPGSVLLSTS